MCEVMWPEYYPEQCPPKEASYVDATVFRLCRDIPPSKEDFIPYKILHPEQNFYGKECQACGLSVYNNIDDIKMLKKINKGLRKHKIYSGHITPKTGLTLATPIKGNSHITWWIGIEQKPEELFQTLVGD